MQNQIMGILIFEHIIILTHILTENIKDTNDNTEITNDNIEKIN